MTARGLAALKALPRYNGTSECDVSVPSGKEELSFRQSGHDNSLDDCFPRLQLGDEQRFVPALAVTCARQLDQPEAAHVLTCGRNAMPAAAARWAMRWQFLATIGMRTR